MDITELTTIVLSQPHIPYETFMVLIGLIFEASGANYAEDADLVRLTKQGNLDAYEKLVQKYQEKIYSYCYYLLSKRREPSEDAKDAIQETFVRCFKKIQSLKKEIAYYAWLRTTAYRICIDLLNKPSAEPITEDIPHPGADPARLVKAEKTRDVVRAAINQLDDKYRLAVTHVHLLGYSYQEAAEIIGCKEDDIRRWLHRGLAKLKEILKDYKDLIK